jgi:hypothetical protein
LNLEKLETINERLLNRFGKFEIQPKFRVVYTDEQFEKRLSLLTPEGLTLATPRTIELPKYPWKPGKFVLEMLHAVPEVNRPELTTKLTYEPLFFFENEKGEALPPKWEVIEIVLSTVLENVNRQQQNKYRDPMSGLRTDDLKEVRKMELDQMKDELFGNETPVGDALAYGHGVSLSGGKHGN